jgi:hypothetical protein
MQAMDERMWQVESNPRTLLGYLEAQGLLSPRKDRLIACAVCRRGWHLLVDARSRQAVEGAELAADGGTVELESLYDAARAVADERDFWGIRMDEYTEATAAHDAIASVDPQDSPAFLVCRDPYLPGAADLVREIIGNPFRPCVLVPDWLSCNGGVAGAVARAIYESGTFADLPVLADALEDAGCADGFLLDHLRSAGPHYRGCWALDLIVGRN